MIIKRIIKGKNLDENLYDPKVLQSFINTQKDKGKRYNTIQGNDDDKYKDIFKDYDDVCRQTNSVDFADLILLSYEMLKNNPRILEYYNSRFKNIFLYIIIFIIILYIYIIFYILSTKQLSYVLIII